MSSASKLSTSAGGSTTTFRNCQLNSRLTSRWAYSPALRNVDEMYTIPWTSLIWDNCCTCVHGDKDPHSVINCWVFHWSLFHSQGWRENTYDNFNFESLLTKLDCHNSPSKDGYCIPSRSASATEQSTYSTKLGKSLLKHFFPSCSVKISNLPCKTETVQFYVIYSIWFCHSTSCHDINEERITFTLQSL